MAVIPHWLNKADQVWVERHGYLLDAIWAHFDRHGDWPEPVELQRQLRASNPGSRPAEALTELPGALVIDEWAHPRHLRLTLFGLACCPEAALLLDRYFRVAALALHRFDSPERPNRLTRSEVVGALGLGEQDADRLSQVLMKEAHFLAGGSSSPAGWDREVDPRVTEFEGCVDIDALLGQIYAQRPQGLAAVLAAGHNSASLSDKHVGRHGESDRPWHVDAPALAAVFTLVASLFFLPAPLALGLLLGYLATLAVLRWRRLTLPWALVIVAVAAIGAGTGALVQARDSSSHSYYVKHTGSRAVVVPLIEPHQDAIMTQKIIGLGEKLEVRCFLGRNGARWAELPEGGFVKASLLRPAFDGAVAPDC